MYVGDGIIMHNWLDYILVGDILIEGKPEVGEWKSVDFGGFMLIHHQREEITEQELIQIIRANVQAGRTE